jgi:serine/threonine protein kinase
VAAGTTGTLLADRYRVLRRLGTGGMASVFLAEDERLGRKVAIKRLHSESAQDLERRFVREAKLGASLNHPNIVSVYDTVTDDEGVLLVMEYVEGETLRDAIARGSVPPETAMKVMRGIASALDHAHEHGVVHRDVKPANILIGGDGRAKLADLGIASAAAATQITRSGTVLGTAAYIAPERLEGGAGGPPSDIYALAAVAYEALSGHKAVEGSTPMEVARRVVSEPPPDLARHWTDAPPAAGEVLKRGMAREPADRPGSARELIGDLGRALATVRDRPTRPTTPLAERSRTAAPPPVAPRGTRRDRAPWLIALAALAAAAVVVLVLLLTSGGSDNKPASHKAKTGAAQSKHKAAPRQAAPALAAGDPAKTFSDFYTSSIGGNIDHAWAISTDNLHAQVGGRESLQRQEADLKNIRFTRLTTTSKTPTAATVAFEDEAQHATFTDDCNGTASLVPGGPQGWLLDRIQVSCSRAGAAQPQPAPTTGNGQGKGEQKPKGAKGKGGD